HRAAARGHARAGAFDLAHHRPRTATPGARRGSGVAPFPDPARAARRAQSAERATTDGERRKALADLKSGLERATRLSEQLLTLARAEPGVDSGGQPPQPVDLSMLAREVVEELAPLAAQKRIDLGLSEAQAATVRGDREAIRTLLSNLVDNALRYTGSGGRVDVATGPDGERSALWVRDNGPGIAPSERDRVFDRFYRGQPAGGDDAGTVVRGSGLGLSIVKRIAERYGATIELGPGIDGAGLCVGVRFPAGTALSLP